MDKRQILNHLLASKCWSRPHSQQRRIDKNYHVKQIKRLLPINPPLLSLFWFIILNIFGASILILGNNLLAPKVFQIYQYFDSTIFSSSLLFAIAVFLGFLNYHQLRNDFGFLYPIYVIFLFELIILILFFGAIFRKEIHSLDIIITIEIIGRIGSLLLWSLYICPEIIKRCRGYYLLYPKKIQIWSHQVFGSSILFISWIVLSTLWMGITPLISIRNTLEITSNNKYIITRTNENIIKVWDVKTGNVCNILRNPSYPNNAHAISNTINYYIYASDKNTIKTINWFDNSKKYTFDGHKQSIRDLYITNDNKYIISSSYDRRIKAWDIKTGYEISTLKVQNQISSLTITKDNSLIIFVERNIWLGKQSLKIFDFQKNQITITLEPQDGKINDLAVSDNDGYIATASNDDVIQIWNLNTKKEIQTLEGHNRDVNYVAFTHDSKRVISASRDKTIKVWDIKTGKELFTMEGYYPRSEIELTHDDKYVVSIDKDNNLQFWDLEKRKEIPIAEVYQGARIQVPSAYDTELHRN